MPCSSDKSTEKPAKKLKEYCGKITKLFADDRTHPMRIPKPRPKIPKSRKDTGKVTPTEATNRRDSGYLSDTQEANSRLLEASRR